MFPGSRSFWPRALAVACVVGVFLASADDGWLLLRSTHFEAITDGGERAARVRLERLERMRAAMTNRFFASARVRVPTRVLLLGMGGVFRSLRPLMTNGPARVDGLFAATPYENQMAIDLDEDERLGGQVTHHELMHLICRDDARRWPLWLGEGVACCYETARFGRGRMEFGLPPRGFPEVLAKRNLFRWSDLLSMDRAALYALDPFEAEVVYPQSWLLAHKLFFGLVPAEAAKLPRLLGLIEAGTNSSRALETVMGWDETRLDAMVRDYARNGHFMADVATVDVRTRGVIRVSRARAADGEAWIALWQMAVGRRADAAARIAAIWTAEGYFPALARGVAAFEGGDKGLAARHFRDAIAARRDSALARAYLARSLVEGQLAEFGPALSREAASEAREALREATRLNPDLQPAFATLGLVEHYGGGDPAAAATALGRALELDPRDFTTRYVAALVHERRGRPSEARRELRLVAENSRRPDLVREAVERLRRLDAAGDGRGAHTNSP
jgi:tetratricopeptide (TPR) repeat protein